MTPNLWLLGSVVVIVLFSIVSSLERSIRESSRTALDDLATNRNRPKLGRRLALNADNPTAHAAAMALLADGLCVAATAGIVFWIAGLRRSTAPDAADVVIGLSVAALVLWITGRIIAQTVAEHMPERAVAAWSILIRSVWIVLVPIRPVAAFFAEVVRRLAGGPSRSEAEAIDAELLSVVEEGEREGRIDETEREMIEAVVDFRSTTADQVMTPRTEVVALEYTDNLDEVLAFLSDAGHSRMPVYEENLDHIVGLLYAKDVLRWLAGDDARDGRPFSLRSILREATFVPETKAIRELLKELIADRVHIAMVADEYGGTAGLVTVEDMVEEIFGEIHDEFEDQETEERPSVDLDPESLSAEIDARERIDDVNDRLEPIRLQLPEDDDYDTVGGFVIVSLGRIPRAGESFEHDGLKIEVLEAEPTRVIRIRIRSTDLPVRATG